MMSPDFLEYIKIGSFGAFSNKNVGPFKPGLNVVFGKNEAGKTTLSAFVSGVLFGWEEARGKRNTYKPRAGERTGSLFFKNSETQEERELSRTRNVDGLAGDSSLVADIDKDTFSTMFFLTSDTLRSLRNTTDVTAKLLTAGSGTNSSPAHALTEVQNRLAEYTSRAAGVEHSLTNLGARQEELRAQIAQAEQEAQRYKQQDKEFCEIEPQRKVLSERLEELNARIEDLRATQAQLQKLEQECESLQEEYTATLDEQARLGAQCETEEGQARFDVGDKGYVSASEERLIRERIESYSERLAKANHRVETAKESYDTSRAAYEALLEASTSDEQQRKNARQRRVQVALSIVLPLVFVCAGVLVFMHGRRITSLSFTALGAGLVLFSLLLAAAALVMLFRPNKADDAQDERIHNAQWVMLQDKKKFEACDDDKEKLYAHIAAQLEEAGLGAAQGSLRRARILLDEMKEQRAESALRTQKAQALTSRLASLEKNIAEAHAQSVALIARAGLSQGANLTDLEAELARKNDQRTSLLETFEHTNRRYGELKQELSQAQSAHTLDTLKLAYQQVRTRQNESAYAFAELLLEKRMLERAIAAWESKSQPEVYRQASRLLSLMTGGRWVKVEMTQQGKLQVTDAVKTTSDPLHLSLGTCQQLYLSLRIALLMTAENVGRAVPILADDILVNFDASRRGAAACALAELARARQVILFTCHAEVVDALTGADPSANVIEL